MWILLVELLLVACVFAEQTTIRIEAYYSRPLSSLFLRGDELCDLTWSQGVKMSMSAIEDFQGSGEKAYQWSIEVPCDSLAFQERSAKGGLEVKVLIDDTHWMVGANHHVRFPASQTRGNKLQTNNNSSSTLATGAVSLVDAFYPWFYTCQGSLATIHNVYSPELKNTRDVIAYLPPSYAENTLKRYRNVLVMHDGQNLFDPATSAFGTAWMCQNTLDSAIVRAQSDELLVIGAYNTPDRMDEYTYVFDASQNAGGKGDNYLDWIESTLLPLIAKQFRVDLTRDSLGILGSSLGGLISCYAGWTRAKMYGKVGCMSSSFWWDDQDFQNRVLVENDIDRSLSLPQFYIDSGTRGGDATAAVQTTQVCEYLRTQRGFTANENVFEFIDQGGAHNEASWGARFYLPIQDLYPPSTV